jgi:hypothetical protein
MALSRAQGVGALLLAASAVAIGIGLYVIGSPATARADRRDDRRTADLGKIAGAVNEYYTKHSTLPGSLDDLKDVRLNLTTVDPFSNTQYEYHLTAPPAYLLCAVFEQLEPVLPVSAPGESWFHTPGRNCFSRVARTAR